MLIVINSGTKKGAVYGQTARSLPLARAAVEAAQTFSTDTQKVAFIGLAGTAHQTACEEAGVKFIPGSYIVVLSIQNWHDGER